MKVLIVSSVDKPLESLSNFLKQNKIESKQILFTDSKQFRESMKIANENYAAVVFDRTYFPISELMDWLADRDCFFILDDYEKIGNFGKISRDFTFRFYFWPLNYTLFLDDLKSITRLKEYMDFGSIKLDEIELNLNRRVLVKGKKEIYLRNKEYELLLYLAKNRGRILSRINILENVWDMNSTVMTNTVDVHISKIRKILENDFGMTELIRTIPCSGYILG